MDFKFSKDSDDLQMDNPAEKKKQSALLVLLLILIGGFSYVYFFTGLIKPQETLKAPEPPVVAQQAVKMPLPARDGETAKAEEKTPDKTDTPKAAAPPPAAAVVPAAVPAVKPAAAPVNPPVAKAVPAPPKPKEEPAKAEAAKPAVKKASPAPAAPAETKKPVAEAKKPAVAEKKSPPAAEAKKPAPAVVPKQETVAKTKNPPTDSWVVVVGNYVLSEALSADMGRVQKAGFEPVVKPSDRKKTTMNRLFVSDSAERETALETLAKLKRFTSDAFVIDQGGRFAVYAGSYLQSESANAEKDRLKAAGFTITLKQTDISIPSQRLSIGPFKNKKDADAALARLKSSGMKAAISQK